MTSAGLKRAKRAVRREVLARRDAIAPGERERLGRLAVSRFLSLDAVVGARTVAAFWSFGSEVPTSPLLDALYDRGVRVALPTVEGGSLALRSWAPGDPVEEASFGAMEPVGGAAIALDQVDVVCTPGVAFDADGRRVGYGGGYYDRLFDTLGEGVFRAAIAFDEQVVDRPLPEGSFDRRIHAVVTPTRTIVIGRAR